jgi:hypothetical protein
MEEFHKEDLEKVRVQFLGYLSYLLNNTPMSQNDENSMVREKLHYLIDICLDAQKEGIKFDRVKYIMDELNRVHLYYKDIMTMKQFIIVMERNQKLENLGI